jgi:rhodanese-related sulfurtransferase
VRRADEFAASRVVGAVNIPLHELLLHLEDVPAGKLWVHCTSGYRAGVAASLLQRAGRDVVHIDARFADAGPAGIAVDTAAA